MTSNFKKIKTMNRKKRKLTKVYSEGVRFKESWLWSIADFFKITLAEGASSQPATHPTPPKPGLCYKTSPRRCPKSWPTESGKQCSFQKWGVSS